VLPTGCRRRPLLPSPASTEGERGLAPGLLLISSTLSSQGAPRCQVGAGAGAQAARTGPRNRCPCWQSTARCWGDAADVPLSSCLRAQAPVAGAAQINTGASSTWLLAVLPRVGVSAKCPCSSIWAFLSSCLIQLFSFCCWYFHVYVRVGKTLYGELWFITLHSSLKGRNESSSARALAVSHLCVSSATC